MSTEESTTNLSDEFPRGNPITIGDRVFVPGEEAGKEVDPKNVSTGDIKELQDKRIFILDNIFGDNNNGFKDSGFMKALDIVKEINHKIEHLDLTLERRRVEEVLRREEAKHPPVLDECPICLDVNINLNDENSFAKFVCCGKYTCMYCKKSDKIRICPMCRSDFPPMKEHFSALQNLTMNGIGWAMTSLGRVYEYGKNGQKVNMSAAVKCYTRAAEEEGNADAMCALARLYSEGVDGILEQSKIRAFNWYKAGAAKHNSLAQVELGKTYHFGIEGVVTTDWEEAIKYLTLAIANDPEFERDDSKEASFLLGTMFQGFGSDESWDRAIFYFTKAKSHSRYEKISQRLLGQAIRERSYEWYDDRTVVTIPGHNVIPQALYWARKAIGNQDEQMEKITLNLIEGLVKEVSGHCGSCAKTAEELSENGASLKKCVRCKAIWYCGKECQRRHWKAGHKKDCSKT